MQFCAILNRYVYDARARTFRLQFCQFLPLPLLKERLHVNERRVSFSEQLHPTISPTRVRIRLSRCYWREGGRNGGGDTPLFLYSRFQIMQKRSSFTFPFPLFLHAGISLSFKPLPTSFTRDFFAKIARTFPPAVPLFL